jgi:rod shape determining protein RodA
MADLFKQIRHLFKHLICIKMLLMISKIIEKINFKLLIPALFVYFLSLISIYSTIPNLAVNHFVYFLLGVAIFCILQVIDSDFFINYSKYIYSFVILLLVLIFIIGHTALGASRWLKIGSLSIQPSEFAKISLILLLTNIWSGLKVWNLKIVEIRNRFLQGFLLFVPLISLVLIQPDLGTSIIIFLIFLIMLTFSSFNKNYILWVFLIACAFSGSFWNLLHDYQRERVVIFINPEIDKFGAGYNSIQATIAVGSGGLTGKGYQKGTQTQLNFLPIFWTDFLVATFAEEWGFIGLLVFILFYGLLINEIKEIALKTSKARHRLIVIGIFTYFCFQFLINVGMNLGLLPVTGIPVPLFSYGGTSLISSIFLLGILNKISVELK